MHVRHPFARKLGRDEHGAVLVITAAVMLTIFVVAAFAIDTAIWWVHARHLQTQADAAAFAGGDVLAAGFENGAGGCSDTAIKNMVAQYDGSQAAVPNQPLPGNQQVNAPPTFATNYSSTAHNLFDEVNQANFKNQSVPADTGLTGSPCADSTVDVKMTETNLPSYLTLIKPPYINKQAQVQLQTVSGAGSAPFVLPNITAPNDVAVFLVQEDPATPAFSSDTVLAALGNCASGNAPPCLTSSNSNATWSAGSVSVQFGSGPVSMVVAQSTSPISSANVGQVATGGQSLGAFCSAPVTCYDQTDGTGLTYTRTYPTPATPPNFPTEAPVVQDAAVSDDPTDPTTQCQKSGSTNLFTGFVASSGGTAGTCLVDVSVDMNFGSSQTCNGLTATNGQNLGATLTVTASSGASVTLTCPGGDNTATTTATGVWKTSTPLAIPVNSGPVSFALKWSRTGGGSQTPLETGWESGGITSGNKAGQCGNASSACTKDFKIVQRIFTGAFDQSSAQTSHSGAIAGAALTNGSGELMYTPANQTQSNLGVTVDFQALYDTPAGPGGYVPNASFNDIAYGTNQGNGLADCGQGVSNGNTDTGRVQEDAIAGVFVCNSFPVIPPPTGCPNGTNTVCPNTVPGGKFLQWLNAGMAARIYGCPETNNQNQNGCPTPITASFCSAHPSYWSTQNLMSDVENNSSDPRLLTIMVTDPVDLHNGNTYVPVRHYAELYITGWTNDPCSGVSGVSGRSSNGLLYYVGDDVAPTAGGDFFLVGHFVKYVAKSDPNNVGSGNLCTASSIDNCVLVLKR